MERPRTPAHAVSYLKNIDEKGTMYAPTAIGWEARIRVTAMCPKRYFLRDDEPTTIFFEGESSTFDLTVSDMSLLALGKLVNDTIQRLPVHRREERSSTGPSADRAGRN